MRQKSLSSRSTTPHNPYPDKGSSSPVHADLPHHSFPNSLTTTIKLSPVCRWGKDTGRAILLPPPSGTETRLGVETGKDWVL